MEQAYWDLDDIIADNQRLGCTMLISVPNLGHLAGADAPSTLLSEHARLTLPYWQAELLALHEIVELHVPKPFAPRVRAALDAQPVSVKLASLANGWYALGSRVANLMESPQLMQLLSKTYTARLNFIFSHAQHLASSEAAANDEGFDGGKGGPDGSAQGSGPLLTPEMLDFVNGLDESERTLLRIALDAARAMREYLSGSG